MNTTWSDIAHVEVPVVLAIGTFDGVHLGHRQLIETAFSDAATCNGEVWVVTFDPHPLSVLRPAEAPPLLISTLQKRDRFRELGVAGTVVVLFDSERANQEPELFIAEIAASIPTLGGIVVGENWRFGKDARGDVNTLRDLGQKHGFRVHIVEAVTQGDAPVSSTRIRAAVADGRMEDAAALLGRPFGMRGTVTRGRSVGRAWGYPTANIIPGPQVHPPAGVYAAYAELDGQLTPGAAYLGTQPTFPGESRPLVLEIHFLDTELALYGREIEVCLVARVREDRRFEGEEALKAQIAVDVATIRELLAPLRLTAKRPPLPAPRDADGSRAGKKG